MGLSVGLVGMPNVGKSSLFNLLTQADALVANYPFATIKPNCASIRVPNSILDQLADLIKPDKKTYAMVEIIDIAGLIEGAAKGEGLGNKFLDHIRQVDLICHVVCCFDDPKVLCSVSQNVAATAAEIVDLELVLADLEVLTRRLQQIKPKVITEGRSCFEATVLTKAIQTLEQGLGLRLVEFQVDELLVLKSFNLLTLKPVLYLANIDEKNNLHFQTLLTYAQKHHSPCLALAVQLELELVNFSADERQTILSEFGLDAGGVNHFIRLMFELLGLATFITFGKKEVRAWSFKLGMKAVDCAAIIHTDLKKGFVKVEVIEAADLLTLKTEVNVKNAGKLRIEGKNYLIKDNEICYFRSSL